MNTVDLIRMSIRATRLNNDDRRVVLYLDESMLAANGTDCLPVLVVDGEGGYYNFLEAYRDQFAAWFGPDYEAAKERVNDLNAESGISPDEAIRIVGDSMFNHSQP